MWSRRERQNEHRGEKSLQRYGRVSKTFEKKKEFKWKEMDIVYPMLFSVEISTTIFYPGT